MCDNHIYPCLDLNEIMLIKFGRVEIGPYYNKTQI